MGTNVISLKTLLPGRKLSLAKAMSLTKRLGSLSSTVYEIAVIHMLIVSLDTFSITVCGSWEGYLSKGFGGVLGNVMLLDH